MIGLMASSPLRAASAVIAADQSPHSASSVRTSRMTLLSTRVPVTSASRQFHNLVGRDAPRALTAHVLDERAAAVRSLGSGCLLHPHRIAVDLEYDIGVREQAQFLPNVHRDRDLSLARDPHGNTPTGKSITPTSLDSDRRGHARILAPSRSPQPGCAGAFPNLLWKRTGRRVSTPTASNRSWSGRL